MSLVGPDLKLESELLIENVNEKSDRGGRLPRNESDVGNKIVLILLSPTKRQDPPGLLVTTKSFGLRVLQGEGVLY